MNRNEIPSVDVLGCRVHAVNLDSAWKAVLHAIQNKEKGYVCVTGTHGITEAQDEPTFRDILNQAFLVVPDGMPLSWMGWLQGAKDMDRVYGPELMLKTCNLGRKHNIKHFLFGGNDGIAQELQTSLENKFPGIEIAGTYTPPFRPLNEEEEQDLKKQVQESQPDIVWVGLSTPKQEKFMAEYLEKLDTTLMFGVGAAFDFHTDKVAMAPSWMQRAGLEWFFRLIKEPKRLWKRYFSIVPRFIICATTQILLGSARKKKSQTI